MNKLKNIVIVILLFIIILNIGLFTYNIFFKKNMNEKATLNSHLHDVKDVVDFIEFKYKNGKFYIEDEKILTKNDDKYENLKDIPKFYGEGYIEINDNKITDLSIQYDNYCISYKDKLVIDKKGCNYNSTSGRASEHIIKNATNDELISDTEKTDFDKSFPFSSKKYFIGDNPHNYLVYENSCYRIVNIAQNDTIKIIYENSVDKYNNCVNTSKENSGMIALMAWDNKTHSDWNNSRLHKTMETWAEEGKIDVVDVVVTIDSSRLEKADWYIGEVSTNNHSVKSNVNDERNNITTDKAYMGMINISDYQKAGARNDENVTKINGKNNYLYKPAYNWWTINPLNVEVKQNSAWQINLDGSVTPETIPFSKDFSYFGIRPVLYLKSELFLSGIGSQYNPYKIVK